MTTSHRILIVDDNPAIHADFRKILAPPDERDVLLDDLEAVLFETAAPGSRALGRYQISSAMQGQEALHLVEQSLAFEHPFALAFVDMRMPPGWDGIETIERIWRVDPKIQIVICSAYSDCAWTDVFARVGTTDSLLILKKPFDTIEVVQCAHALATKWTLARKVAAHVLDLETTVAARTRDLEDTNARLLDEMHTRMRMEGELRLAQKLEAVGQLAAGVAHEINTPIQYVGDNLTFLQESIGVLLGTVTEMVAVAAAARNEATAAIVDRLATLADDADVAYLAGAIPDALASTTNGVARIAKIVRAMKGLVHNGPDEAAPVDIALALGNALEVAAPSYRLVADVATDFAVTPPVVCHGSEITQVFLNLIVNAAQAMEDMPDRRGLLRVATRVEADDLVVTIADTGPGIPEAHRDRVFDVFFTTKEVGRGTGQGLAISRSIVDRHGGTLTFVSVVGEGTTFTVRIPIEGHAITSRAA